MLAREFRTQGVQFEPNIREDLAKLSHSLDEYFNVEKLEFICKNSDRAVFRGRTRCNEDNNAKI